jgi:hypothetical protein
MCVWISATWAVYCAGYNVKLFDWIFYGKGGPVLMPLTLAEARIWLNITLTKLSMFATVLGAVSERARCTLLV